MQDAPSTRTTVTLRATGMIFFRASLLLAAEALAQRRRSRGVAAVTQQLRQRVDRLHRLWGLRTERLALQRVCVHRRRLGRAPLLREQQLAYLQHSF